MLRSLWKFVKRRLFVARNVKVGRNFHIGFLSYISAPIALNIADDVYIGKFCSIQCSGNIGSGVLIANNVGIIGRSDHDLKAIGLPIRLAPWIGEHKYLGENPRNWVEIGDDVWIGFGAVVLSGVSIGRGAIVAAGAVVVNDVAPYAIVAGNPARKVSMRFTAEEVKQHERKLASSKACN